MTHIFLVVMSPCPPILRFPIACCVIISLSAAITGPSPPTLGFAAPAYNYWYNDGYPALEPFLLVRFLWVSQLPVMAFYCWDVAARATAASRT